MKKKNNFKVVVTNTAKKFLVEVFDASTKKLIIATPGVHLYFTHNKKNYIVFGTDYDEFTGGTVWEMNRIC